MITTSEGEKFEDYSKYLTHSKHWRLIKTRFKNSRKPNVRCENCGATRQLAVHHKTYERLGNESLEDLSLLCRKCHAIVHGRHPNSFNYSTNTISLYDADACRDFLSHYEHEIAPYLY